MRLERTINSFRNIKYGIINRIIGIIMPFIVRTIFINTLGTEFLGLNSLFTSVLTVLNLTELGFSNAIVFCMYKPIAEEDRKTIDALLNFYRKVYFIIGLIILIGGLSIIPILPKFITGTYPSNINLVIVYVIFLINTVASYFLYAYLQAIISGFQREDILSKTNIIVTTLMYFAQIIILLNTKNYYLYILIMPIFTIANNIRIAFIAKKVFPEYHASGKIDKKNMIIIKEKVKGLVVSKVCQVSRNALDSIFLSMFLGLTETAIYNNYYYIMNSLVAITSVLISSIVAGAGNSVAIESEEKNYLDMNRMNFIYMWLSGWFTICLFCLYQPFMKIWVGENLLLPINCVLLICLYFYVLKMGDIRSIYDQASGLWWENRYRALTEAVCNLILNYILGKYFGINGIISATLISLFLINFCWGSGIIFKYYFINQKVTKYFLAHFRYFIVTCFSCIITWIICRTASDGMFGFILKMFICITIPNFLYWMIYKRTQEFKTSVSWLMDKIPILKSFTFNKNKL